MKIVTKEELRQYPNGTVFTEWIPRINTTAITIKTGYYESKNPGYEGPHWNGELSLIPSNEKFDEGLITNWWTYDGSDADYKDDQLFAVFSKTDVMQMINCLTWALTGCEGHFNQDVSYTDDGIALIED